MAEKTNNLLDVIEQDLEDVGHWLVAEAEGVAVGLWDILKTGFLLLTEAQAQIILDLLNKLSEDIAAGKSVEEIETDLLNLASAEERAVIDAAGSNTLQALIASWKAKVAV